MVSLSSSQAQRVPYLAAPNLPVSLSFALTQIGGGETVFPLCYPQRRKADRLETTD